MTVDELVAKFSFAIEGLQKVRKAIDLFQKLAKAVAAFSLTVAKRMGRLAGLLVRTTALAAGVGTAFVASSALITTAAGTITAGLAAIAAGFAKLKKTTIDSALVNGVDIRHLALVEDVMTRVGASAQDGRKFLGEFAEKLREGIKDGGDFADTLAKAGVKLKDRKGVGKGYDEVISEILKAADKMKTLEKKRVFLKDALPGVPDEFLASLLQSTSAFEKWKTLVKETRKLGGGTSHGDTLNATDITDSMQKMQVALNGFTDAIGSGLMASFAKNFRDLGNAVASVATDENRKRLREFVGDIAQLMKDITKGGFIVFGKVAEAFKGITGALATLDEASGGRLRQLGIGLGVLVGGVTAVAAGPLIAVSAAITAILFAVQKFSEWKDGGKNVLSDFFDTIANAARDAKAAVDGLLSALKSFPSLGNIISPAAPAGAQGSARTKTIMDGIEGLERLRQKQSEMSSEAMARRLAADRAGGSGGGRGATVSAPVTATATATFNGIMDAAAVAKIKGMISDAMAEAASKFSVGIVKATNAQSRYSTNGVSGP